MQSISGKGVFSSYQWLEFLNSVLWWLLLLFLGLPWPFSVFLSNDIQQWLFCSLYNAFDWTIAVRDIWFERIKFNAKIFLAFLITECIWDSCIWNGWNYPCLSVEWHKSLWLYPKIDAYWSSYAQTFEWSVQQNLQLPKHQW